jgi:hypothetical protein
MSKMLLNPEELAVQSFPTTTDDEARRRGTVRGMDSGASCDQDTCVAADTCAPACTRVDTCPASTCAQTCLASCASCPVSCHPADCPSADGRC